MRQSKISLVFFSDFISMAKHMIVLHLDSSKSERCALKFFKNVLSEIQRKEPDNENQITLKLVNEPLQGLAEKQLVDNDQSQLIVIHPC